MALRVRAFGAIWTVWSGMSKAGWAALRDVTSGSKLAVQHVDTSPYIAENCLLQTQNWMPIVLLPEERWQPAHPKFATAASPLLQQRTRAWAVEKGVTGCTLVTASSTSATADRFAVA